MRFLLVTILTVMLLMTFSLTATAELLFGVSAETGPIDFSADYSNVSLTDISQKPNLVILNGDLNLIGTHLYLNYGLANLNKAGFSTTGIKIGWEPGLDVARIKIFGGYQQYNFNDDHLTSVKNNTYAGLVTGIGAETKIGKTTLHGSTYFPVYIGFSNGVTTDDQAKMSYYELGVAYSPIPLFDVFINYRNLQADSSIVNISAHGYTAGAKLSF